MTINPPQLIFDFDGTLVDSFATIVEQFNQLADEFGFRKVASNEIPGLKDLTSKQLIKHLDVPLLKMPMVLLKAREALRQDMQHLEPVASFPEVLQVIHDLKVPMSILTSNSSENVEAWLKRHQLRHFFNFIHDEVDYFGKDQSLRKILKAYQMDPSQTFYVGDETRDVEAAKACGLSSIAVTWGFNSEKVLAQQQPAYLLREPKELLLLFQES